MIGIDLGTTNSCVALRGPFGDVESVAVATGPRPPYDTVLRTAVLNPQQDRALIGQEAFNRAASQRLTAEDRYLESFKPYLDQQKLRTRVPVEVKVGFVYDPMTQSTVQKTATRTLWVGGRYTREELIQSTAHIFSHLLQAAQDAGGDLDEIWLGMPVSFSGCARKRLVSALMRAWDDRGRALFGGLRDVLDRVRFVLEPVAVAAAPLGEALDLADRETVLVFDHGGGTLDLSLISFERRPEFEQPVPVRELAAVGSADVAGQAIDLHFREHLDRLPAFATATQGRRTHAVDAFVEECKQRLSTEPTAEAWPNVFVERDDLERAISPVLDKIEQLVRTVVSLGDRGPEDIDRVVMTGGSSLIPAVQQRVQSIFGHLDEYRLLRYDPSDRRGVESAITEVAKGLVSFGDRVARQGFFEQVALWDIDLAVGAKRGMQRILRRGKPYERDTDGSPMLELRIPIEPVRGQGTSLGLYEDQLGPRFMFGLSDLPPLPQGGELRVALRPEALLPSMKLIGPDGRVVLREIRDPACKSEWLAQADVQAMSEELLRRYFKDDADYHPVNGYLRFESSPLVRPLRIGDLVEWCPATDGVGPRRKLRHCRGELERMRNIRTGQFVEEMESLELSEYFFTLREKDGAVTSNMQGRGGSLRLSPRPWRDF